LLVQILRGNSRNARNPAGTRLDLLSLIIHVV
jgi:hypothetical protein